MVKTVIRSQTFSILFKIKEIVYSVIINLNRKLQKRVIFRKKMKFMEKIKRFKDIPQLTRYGNWQINISLADVPYKIKKWQEDSYYNLQLNPDFQRGHVWTKEQQIAYIEFILKGGKPARTIYFNMPSWNGLIPSTQYNDFVCVDGLQRITAVLKFMRNEIKVFGSYYREFEDNMPSNAELFFNVNNLQTKKEVLQWYVDMNAGGTPHTNDEIERVRKMIRELI